jgi:hypothetical protein
MLDNFAHSAFKPANLLETTFGTDRFIAVAAAKRSWTRQLLLPAVWAIPGQRAPAQIRAGLGGNKLSFLRAKRFTKVMIIVPRV